MMMKLYAYVFLLAALLSACTGKDKPNDKDKILVPEVTNNGNDIVFATPQSIGFFTTEKIETEPMSAEVTAPAKISATVLASQEGASQNIVLFDNPELAGNYTQLIQHTININQIQNINIKQRKIELDRIKDLQQHGAASGKELLEAQTALSMEETNLANERAAIIEHETKLKAGGFNPEVLKKAAPGTAYVVCDIPESQISKIKEGNTCKIAFTAFPNETFTGKIDDVADMIDNTTRMIKLRVSVDNSNGQLKAGMFATVSFSLSEGNNTSVNKNALITVQGKSYVFVKTNATTFERREVNTGIQVGDRILVYNGLKDNDEVAIKGVMQLKGLSFGY